MNAILVHVDTNENHRRDAVGRDAMMSEKNVRSSSYLYFINVLQSAKSAQRKW
jgi:hypothetical protein